MQNIHIVIAKFVASSVRVEVAEAKGRGVDGAQGVIDKFEILILGRQF
jgi:thymidine phosphorylase